MNRSWSRTTLSIAGGGTGTADKPVTITFWGLGQGHQGGRGRVQRLAREHPGEVRGDPVRQRRRLRQDLHRDQGGQRPRPGLRRVPDAPRARRPGRVPGHQRVPGRRREEEVPPAGDRADDARRQELGRPLRRRTAGIVPFDAAPQAFFYRKDRFTKYGVDVPKTWDEFKAAAEKIKKADSKARIGTFFPDDPTTFEAMVWQAGAQWFKADGDTWKVDTSDAATTKVADYWQGLVKDGLVRADASFSPPGPTP